MTVIIILLKNKSEFHVISKKSKIVLNGMRSIFPVFFLARDTLGPTQGTFPSKGPHCLSVVWGISAAYDAIHRAERLDSGPPTGVAGGSYRPTDPAKGHTQKPERK